MFNQITALKRLKGLNGFKWSVVNDQDYCSFHQQVLGGSYEAIMEGLVKYLM
jgi:hypothetical protein